MTHPEATHQLTPEGIAEGLRAVRVGRRIVVLPEIDSTNTHALETIAPREGHAADGTVIFAERQTSGRGRLGRRWHSPTGASLMFTVLLHEPENAARAAFWTMAAALGVARGVESATDISPQIRWPNDVYVGSRKLAGILVEARLTRGDGWIAVGIGLNCLQQPAHFPDEIRTSATSLEIESTSPIDRAAVARNILQVLDEYFAQPSLVREDALAAEWSDRSSDIGQHVTLRSGLEPFTGRIIDVHPREGLLLHLDIGGRRHFDPATTSRVK